MRREDRKLVRVRGWITGMGAARFQCMVEDMSRGGAKIIIERGHPPDEFELYFSLTAQNFRKCRVRWRRKEAVGVEFVRRSLIEAAAGSAGTQP
jgi:hypothetical protein